MIHNLTKPLPKDGISQFYRMRIRGILNEATVAHFKKLLASPSDFGSRRYFLAHTFSTHRIRVYLPIYDYIQK